MSTIIIIIIIIILKHASKHVTVDANITKRNKSSKKMKNDRCATDANKVIQLKITIMIISWSCLSRIFGYISK